MTELQVESVKRRADIVRGIRRFFDERDFLEVETPVRIAAPAPECHIDCPPVLDIPFPVPSVGEAGTPPLRDVSYLRASPELQMKKLLAAGLDRIYQIGPCFREGERGSRHNPEFTMIEWYRRNATYLDIKDDLASLVSRLLSSQQDSRLETDAAKLGEIRVRDAYLRFAGWDPWAGWDQDRFDFDMATVIEPKLKELGGGVFLMDYPVQAASLARIVKGADGSSYAERWEFYWDGMELANCFTELCDEDEQRRRFAQAKAERRELGESDYPLDEDFFACLPQIGSAAGVALGVDRLVMVLLGAKDILSVRAGE